MAEFQYTPSMMEADNPTERIGAGTADPGYIASQDTSAYGPSAGGVSAETIKKLLSAMPSSGITDVEKEIVARAREKAKGRAGAEKMQEDLLVRQIGLTEESARQQAKTLEEKAAGEAVAQKAYAEGIAAAAEKAKPGKVPEFTPSQASVGELITMFTLINTMAFMVGGKGRSSGMAALASLNGALDGYKKGRQDIYKMEMINFDKNLKSFQQEIENQKAEFQRDVAKQGASRDSIIAAMKVVEAKNVGAQLGIDARAKNVAAVSKHYENIIKGINNAEQTLMKFGNDQRKYELDRIRAQAAQTQAAAAMMRAAGGNQGGQKLPKEIVQANSLRNNLIPKIQEAIPILDRLQNEGKWRQLTTLLAMPLGTNAAEYKFRDDPEAIKLINILSYFRSKEFETAGKALTKREDQILRPIYSGELRVYEGIRNALVQGLDTIIKEQKGFEAAYPLLITINEAFKDAKELTPEEKKELKERRKKREEEEQRKGRKAMGERS